MSLEKLLAIGIAASALAVALPATLVAQQPGLDTPVLVQRAAQAPIRQLHAASAAKGGGDGLLLVPKACVVDTIDCGDLEHGELESGDCTLDDGTYVDFWQFQGTSGTTVTIELSSSAFDAFLFLLDPVPDVVASDDDSGSGSNARIVHTLDSSGAWSIGANSFMPATGNYSLRLTCGGTPPSQVPAAPSNLTATAMSTTQAHLTWQDNSTNETSFRVEARPVGGSFQEIGSVPADTTAVDVTNLQAGGSFQFRVRARNAAGSSAYSDVASVTLPADAGGWLTTSEYPGFRFRVTFTPPGGAPIQGVKESGCIPEALCVSGSLPGRSEVFVRIVGPKPNGYLWPTLVKFSTSQVDVWIEQLATSITKHYTLAGAAPGNDELQGLFDREGFLP